MLFVLNELVDLHRINNLPGCEEATPDTVEAILEEHAKFAGEVVAPLNWVGDQAPSFWKDGQVTTTKGFKEAYLQFAEAGWQGRVWWAGLAENRAHGVPGNAEFGIVVVCAVPVAD